VSWARSGSVTLTRRQAVDHVLRFIVPALRANEPVER